MGGDDCTVSSTDILNHLCTIKWDNNDFFIRLVGGALHSILFPEYKSCDVDLHFVTVMKVEYTQYKCILESFEKMHDPFIRDDKDEIKKIIKQNHEYFNEVLKICLGAENKNKFIGQLTNHYIIKQEISFAKSYFKIMDTISKGFNNFKFDNSFNNMPNIYTKEAYDEFDTCSYKYDAYIKMCIIQPAWILPNIIIALNSIKKETEGDKYKRWNLYNKFCYKLYHEHNIFLILHPNKKHMLTISYNRYFSIELDESNAELQFFTNKPDQIYIIAIAVFKTVSNKPVWDVIIDSGLHTPLTCNNDQYLIEKHRMYFSGKSSNDPDKDNLLYDTSESYIKELYMRAIENEKNKNKLERIVNRLSSVKKKRSPKSPPLKKVKYNDMLVKFSELQSINRQMNTRKICS